MSPQQLQMVWLPGQPVRTLPPLPAGYLLRPYQPGDDEAYIALMQSAGFTTWSPDHLKRVLATCLPGGVLFAVYQPTGALAATACATHSPREFHPAAGELGWVAANPEHRGKGLGHALCAEVTGLFLAHGVTDIYLLTDDFRLPAIKIYLTLGWVPFLHAPDMLERWQLVFQQLGMTFDPSLARKPEEA